MHVALCAHGMCAGIYEVERLGSQTILAVVVTTAASTINTKNGVPADFLKIIIHLYISYSQLEGGMPFWVDKRTSRFAHDKMSVV